MDEKTRVGGSPLIREFIEYLEFRAKVLTLQIETAQKTIEAYGGELEGVRRWLAELKPVGTLWAMECGKCDWSSQWVATSDVQIAKNAGREHERRYGHQCGLSYHPPLT